jgi:hypothetical protein
VNCLIDGFIKVLCKVDHVRRFRSKGRGRSCQGLDLGNHSKSSHMQDAEEIVDDEHSTVQLARGGVNLKQMWGIH